MRRISFPLIALSLMLVGCIPTNTPTAGSDIRSAIHGSWQIETWYMRPVPSPLGTISMDANSYEFALLDRSESMEAAQNDFCFVGQPVGSVVFEYQPDVSPDDDLRIFDQDEILAKISFNCGDTFYIRVDQEGHKLYLHSVVSKIELYRIYKDWRN